MEDDCTQGEPVDDEPREDAALERRQWGSRSSYSPPREYGSGRWRKPFYQVTPEEED